MDSNVRMTTLSMSGIIRNDNEFNQQAIDSHSFMSTQDITAQKDCKSMGYDLGGKPMAVDMLYKRAAEIYGNQNRYRGENSCDSFNSKMSQAYVAHVGPASLNAEDSGSSARSSHKSHNQVGFHLSLSLSS